MDPLTAPRIGDRLAPCAALAVAGGLLGHAFIDSKLGPPLVTGSAVVLLAGFLWARVECRETRSALPVVVWVLSIAAGASPVFFRKSFDDERIGPLPTTTVTIRVAARGITLDTGHAIEVPDEARAVVVELPERRPTIRQIQDSVASQTPYELVFSRCGTGATLLHPAYVGDGWVERQVDR